jgi:hypothetical protein
MLDFQLNNLKKVKRVTWLGSSIGGTFLSLSKPTVQNKAVDQEYSKLTEFY